jgi:hypothetical protein
MKALVWKELRALRTPALLVLGLLAATVPVQVLYLRAHPWAPEAPMLLWWEGLPALALALGCYLVARERARGELQFASAWPVSRGKVWAAKLLTGVGLLALLYGLVVYTSVWTDTGFWYETMLGDGLPGMAPFWMHPAGSFVVFAVGLLFSTIRSGPFEALAVSILGLVLVSVLSVALLGVVAPQLWGPQLGIHIFSPQSHAALFCTTAAVLGGIAIVASAAGALSGAPLDFSRRQRQALIVWLALAALSLPLILVGVRVLGQPTPADVWPDLFARVTARGDRLWVSEERDTLSDRSCGLWDSSIEWPRLWLMNADGTDLRCVSRGPAWVASLQGGRTLVFVWGEAYMALSIWVPPSRAWALDTRTGGLRRLPVLPTPGMDLPDWNVAVSPSGSYAIANRRIVRLGDRPELLATQLPEQAQWVLGWSPDETGVYFATKLEEGQRAEVWRMGLAAGGNLRRIARAPAAEWRPVGMSPDARWLAWRLQTPPERLDDWGEWASACRLEGVATGRQVAVENARPVLNPWSPDSRYFWSHWWDRIAVVDLAKCKVPAAAPCPVRPFPSPHELYWSVDGARTAFVTSSALQPPGANVDRDEKWREGLWVANADGSGLRRVAETAAGESLRWDLAGWTDDGKVMMVEDSARLVAVDPDNGEREVIFEAPGAKGGEAG